MTTLPYDDDAERYAIEAEQVGGPVDPPDRPVTFADVVSRTDQRRPIVPAAVRSADGRRALVRWSAGYGTHAALYHLTRTPKYAAKMALWAPWGLLRTVGRILRWASAEEGNWTLRQQAANRNDPAAWLALDRTRERHARWRWSLVAAGALAVAVALAVLLALAPSWAVPLLVGVTLPMLAWAGRPADRPILDRVATGARFVKLTAEQVRAALCSIGIGAIKDPAALKFPQDIHRDGPGWLARVNLPAGVEAVDVLERRGRLSSALRLPVDQVWPVAGPEHAGQLDLWVGFQPASRMGQPRWALASPSARTSVFEPIPFGTDQRQRPVSTTLFQRNYLIGGQPGSGKTFAGRAIVLGALLDPTAEVWLAAFKPSEDFHDVSEFCTRYVCGVDPATMEYAEQMVADGLREVHRRQALLGKLKREGRIAEGRTDPELAAKGIGLHPLVLVFDEVHELFLESKQAVEDMIRLVKQGRSAGVTAVLITQVADKDSVPPNVTRCVSSRWCLSVSDQVANDQIMGTGAYKRGQSGAVYRPRVDAGWGATSGLSDDYEGPVRAYYPDGRDLAVVLDRIRLLRGGRTFTTAADPAARRDVLADVLRVFATAGRRGLHWQTLAEQLAEQMPEQYAEITAEAVSAMVRDKGVPSVDVKVDGVTLKGCKRVEIDAAIARREITS